MSLIISSTDAKLTQTFLAILKHYFKHPSSQLQQNQSKESKQYASTQQTTNGTQSTQFSGACQSTLRILINTKYYTSSVQITINDFNQHIPKSDARTDMIIFLFNELNKVDNIGQKIDGYIQQYRPESTMICVQTLDTESEEGWQYQDEVSQCDNYVPIVYENIEKVEQTLPKWESSGLLKQSEDDQQIFCLFDLLETTSWFNLQKKVSLPKSEQGKESKEQKKVEAVNLGVEKEEKEEKEEIAGVNDDEYEPTEEQLQQEMKQFEMLMSHMMQIKELPAEGNERKQKAQELILKLAKNFQQ